MQPQSIKMLYHVTYMVTELVENNQSLDIIVDTESMHPHGWSQKLWRSSQGARVHHNSRQPVAQ